MLIIAVCYEHGTIRTSTGLEEQTYRGISPLTILSTVLPEISQTPKASNIYHFKNKSLYFLPQNFKVETEINKRKEDKHGSSSKSEAQDKAIQLLNLR